MCDYWLFHVGMAFCWQTQPLLFSESTHFLSVGLGTALEPLFKNPLLLGHINCLSGCYRLCHEITQDRLMHSQMPQKITTAAMTFARKIQNHRTYITMAFLPFHTKRFGFHFAKLMWFITIKVFFIITSTPFASTLKLFSLDLAW